MFTRNSLNDKEFQTIVDNIQRQLASMSNEQLDTLADVICFEIWDREERNEN